MLTLVAVMAGVEAGAVYLYYRDTGHFFYDTRTRQQQLLATLGGRGITTQLHPFYGFLQAWDEPSRKTAGIIPNRYGYPQVAAYWQIPGCCEFPFPPEEREQMFLVGVFGASVAHGLGDYLQLFPEVTKPLESLPAAAKKRIVVLNLAVGGHHQPQYLMALTHLLSIGMKFDLVLLFGVPPEIDAPIANIRAGVAPDFPVSVWTMMSRALDQQASNDPANLLSLFLTAAAQRMERLGEGCVVAACVAALRPAIGAARGLAERLARKAPPAGPPSPHFFTARARDPKAPLESARAEAAALWRRSVRLMADLTRASGGAFWTVLLPNPWDHAGRVEPAVDDERNRPRLRENATRAMATLKQIQAEFSRSGISAVDATRIVDDLAPTSDLFLDAHGHFGQVGMKRVCEFTMQQIASRHAVQ
jgi:hypothetical protein